MVIKKSKLYAFLWSRSSKLRGPMKVDEFKDYVLVLLFVKYASDRYADVPDAPIKIPAGAGFRDLVALKHDPEIGRRINERILAPLAAANQLADLPDFDDAAKLGTGRERVDRLTQLISIFEHPEVDFSTVRPEEDEDLLGGAYEYFMRYCVSRRRPGGELYTPREVSRLIAQVLGIGATTPDVANVYDPICGFGSPLVQLQAEANRKLALYAQTGTAVSSGLTRMHLRLRDRAWPVPAAADDQLKSFDFVVASPPLGSDLRLGAGSPRPDPLSDSHHDPYRRFQSFGTPSQRSSGYAYLLHVVQSLNTTGRGVCVLPQRALSRGSRGDAEAEIRWTLIRKGLISSVIGLPSDVFFGTGIAMSLVVVDRRTAHARKGIFMIDAGLGCVKDGLKNRLREEDVRKIVDVFHGRIETPHYSRLVPYRELAEADFNLNVARFISRSRPLGIGNPIDSRTSGIVGLDVESLRNAR